MSDTSSCGDSAAALVGRPLTVVFTPSAYGFSTSGDGAEKPLGRYGRFTSPPPPLKEEKVRGQGDTSLENGSPICCNSGKNPKESIAADSGFSTRRTALSVNESAGVCVSGNASSSSLCMPPLLGKYGEFSSQNPDEKLSHRVRMSDELRDGNRVWRFALQTGARELLKHHKGIQGCLRWPRAGVQEIEVYHKPLTRSARLGGLQTCGSVWDCPVCAGKVTEYRRMKLGAAVKAWRDQGGMVVMITYTIRHKASDSLPHLVRSLARARGFLSSGAPGQRLYRRHGIIGTVRALEVTSGYEAEKDNGWHPHVHELLFVPAGVDLHRMTEDFRDRWQVSIAHAGLSAVSRERGLKVDGGWREIEEYIAKYGDDGRSWGIEHEVTKHPTKLGRAGHLTPLQLLAKFTFEGDLQAGALYRDYADSFRGRAQLYWSKGLAAKLIPEWGEEPTEQEIAQQITDHVEVLLATIHRSEWRILVKADAVPLVINAARTGEKWRVTELILRVIAEEVSAAGSSRTRGRAALTSSVTSSRGGEDYGSDFTCISIDEGG